MGWIGPAVSAATSIGSGIKGKQAANQADQKANAFDEQLMGMMGGAMGQLDDLGQRRDAFLNGAIDPNALANQAATGGQAYQNTLAGLAGQLQGGVPGMNFGPVAGSSITETAAQNLGGMQGAGYDFGPGREIQAQAMQNFQEYASGAQDAALEQAGQAFTGGQRALDAALASRGMSRDSGVAAAETANMARQGAQSQVNLARDLAAQAGQIGLDATKFDIGSGLQREGMESNFALGSAGQGLQAAQAAGQLGLGIGQNYLTNQGQQADYNLGTAAQNAQNVGLAGELATQGYMNPLQVQQQMFQQNQMQPYLQMASMTNPMQMLSSIMALQGGNLERRADQNTGANFGGLGGALGDLSSSIKGKDSGGPGGGSMTYP